MDGSTSTKPSLCDSSPKCEVLAFTEDDYPLLKSLLEKRHSFVVPYSFLPKNGFLAKVEGQPVAIGFLLQTDTPVASISSVCTDPDIAGWKRDMGLIALIKAIEQCAIAKGFSAISSFTSNEGLSKRYDRMGYSRIDHNANAFARVLCQ